MVENIRWHLSLAVWRLWLKVTPEHPFKHAIVDAVVLIGQGVDARKPHKGSAHG